MRKHADHRAKRRGDRARPAAAAPPATAASLGALAAAVGRSKAAVAKWTARPDWPFGPPPWPIERVHEWAAVALSPDPAAAMRERLRQDGGAFGVTLTPARARAELAQILARTKLLLQQHEGNAVKLHDSEGCRARRLRQDQVVRESFLALARTVAARLVGQEKDEIERLFLVEIAAVCNSFAAGSGAKQSGRGDEAGSSGAAAAPPARGRHPDATTAAENPAREAAPQ